MIAEDGGGDDDHHTRLLPLLNQKFKNFVALDI